MYALVGRVRIKPGHEEEARGMAAEHGPAILKSFPETQGGYWARPEPDGEGVMQHSFWLFDTEEGVRAAEATFRTLRDMPDAPAIFVSVDVCEVISQAP